MIRRPPRSTQSRSSAASDVYKRQDEDGLGQILSYNEAQERVLSGKSKDPQPVWYFVFVTAYKDGIVPERMGSSVTKGRTLVHLVVVAPEKMEERMEFVNAADMARSLTNSM